jgi:cyclopropane fatty-acyl-phospholipid synthase-like methyltransferase
MDERATPPTRRTLRSKIVAQFGRPKGIVGRLVGLVMATRPSNRERNRRTVELLQIGDGDRVLEIGFGPGLAIELAARRAQSGTVVGVDHSEMMLRQASRRNRAAIAAGRVQLHLASAEELPAFAELFDKVMASNVYMFLDDAVATLRRWLVVMRPGGWIAITHQSRRRGATDADTARDADRIAADLGAAGFTGVRIETLEIKPVNAACVLGRRPT